jgi:hypothetical protein
MQAADSKKKQLQLCVWSITRPEEAQEKVAQLEGMISYVFLVFVSVVCLFVCLFVCVCLCVCVCVCGA